MFKLADAGTLYRTEMKVVVPLEDGGTTEAEMVMLLRCLPTVEFAELREKTERDPDILAHIVGGWEGIEDENGDPLPFTKENLNRLTQLPYIAVGIYAAYNERFVPVKNF